MLNDRFTINHNYLADGPGACVPSAIALTSRIDYAKVKNDLIHMNVDKGLTGRDADPRYGVYPTIFKQYLKDLGFIWTPCMKRGSGCRVHVRPSELPETGRHILRLSKHVVALIDGELWDTQDPSRNGTRCVYGYWTYQE